MEKSAIIANLEGILEPVPKENRIILKINPAFQQWYAFIKKEKPPEYDELLERNNRENVETVNELVAALNRRENIEIATELRRYYNSAYACRKEAVRLIRDSALVQMLGIIKEDMDGFLGCSTGEVKISCECDLNSSYSPEKAEIRIAGISLPADPGKNRIPCDISHEYCHHMQFSTNLPTLWIKQAVISEGFANCAGRAGAELYGQIKKNTKIKSRIRYTLYRQLEDFRELYVDHNFEGYTSLADICYTIGTTAFLVAEARRGKSIYREIIRSANPAEYLIRKLR
ncbi:MAG: hypothetical protein QME12_01980 [Nanoarchaeota archaeon]|nr:hypothetical protein [Nanoarchaeota archaeon]